MKGELIILKIAPDVKFSIVNYWPICREHHFELDAGYTNENGYWVQSEVESGSQWMTELRCLEGPHNITLPITLGEIQNYIRKKVKSKQYMDAKLVDLDGLLVPVSKKYKVLSEDTGYFITSQIRSNNRGDQLVIYAGKKGEKDKEKRTQIFIDPEHKKLSFDQNDLNPIDVFVKLEATFRDGSKHIIKTGEE